MPAFGNPVPGPIHEKGWSRPTGNIEYVVKRTFDDHIGTGTYAKPQYGLGIDIGNLRCGGPVLAMQSGTVWFAGPKPMHDPPLLGDGSLSVSIRAGGWEVGVTHLLDIVVKAGDTVTVGQIIGHCGKTGYGITACHVHWHVKELVNGAYKHRDGWPLLAQNQPKPEEDPMTKILSILPPGNVAIPANSKTYAAPSLASASAPSGTLAVKRPAFYIVADADGTAVEWVEFVNASAGVRRYIPRSVVTLEPTQVYTQEYVNAQVKAAKNSAADAVLEAAKTAAAPFGAS